LHHRLYSRTVYHHLSHIHNKIYEIRKRKLNSVHIETLIREDSPQKHRCTKNTEKKTTHESRNPISEPGLYITTV